MARTFFDDAAHVRQKSHVEHPVGLVEDEELNLMQPDFILAQEIQQASRSGDENIGAALDGFALFAVADAAEDDGGAQVGESPVIAKRRLDLRGEFACRFQHKATAGAVALQFGEDRKGKSGGFTGAGLCAADDVFSGEDERDGAGLDGGGL